MKKLVFVFLLSCLLIALAVAQTEANEPTAGPQGVLQLSEGISLKVVPHNRSKKSVRPENGKALLPYGEYTVEYWIYQKKDADGTPWKIKAYPAETMAFEIGAQPASLTITPEPVAAALTVRCRGDYQFSLDLKGPAGEKCYLSRRDVRVSPPTLEITNRDKSFNITLPSEYG